MEIPFDTRIFEDTSERDTRDAEFVRGLAEVYRDVYAAALSIVGNRAGADDVVQEVCVVLWQKYDEFKPGTSFRKWACTVAFNVAKAFVRQRRRRRGYGLNDEALAKIAHMRSGGSEVLELRRETLANCFAKLAPRDQRFLRNCYRGRRTLVEYARVIDVPVTSVYTRLKRLRKRLAECVRRSLGEDF